MEDNIAEAMTLDQALKLLNTHFDGKLHNVQCGFPSIAITDKLVFSDMQGNKLGTVDIRSDQKLYMDEKTGKITLHIYFENLKFADEK